jgi:integrase
LHLTSVLKSKPVALLMPIELKKWRDGLLGTMAPSTINRLCGCLRAALNLAARHDKRIQNREAWEVGLVNLPDAQQARNVILSDDKVREFVAAAYELDDKFGLFTDTLAITGARPSQAVRLRVEDLHDHPVRPKLMMSKAAKGGSRKRVEKKQQRYSVPITTQLAVKLKAAAKSRADHAPLLLQSDGSPWGANPGASYHNDVKKIVAAIGADPDATMYALRHSSIVRMLLLNVPVRLVAELHNTSIKMIERHYSKFITEHSDDISRRALLQHEELQPAVADNQQNPQRKHEQAPIEIGTSNQEYDRDDVSPDREPTRRQTCVDGNGRRRDHEDRRRLYQVNVDHPVRQGATEMKSSGVDERVGCRTKCDYDRANDCGGNEQHGQQ